jgi:hypothetical protein
MYTLYTFDQFFPFPIVFLSKKGVNTCAENKFFSSYHLSECLDFCRAVIILLLCVLPAEQNNIQKMVAEFTVLTFFIVIANKRIL